MNIIFNTDNSFRTEKHFKACNNIIYSNCWFPVRLYFSIHTKNKNRPIFVINGETIEIILPEPQKREEITRPESILTIAWFQMTL